MGNAVGTSAHLVDAAPVGGVGCWSSTRRSTRQHGGWRGRGRGWGRGLRGALAFNEARRARRRRGCPVPICSGYPLLLIGGRASERLEAKRGAVALDEEPNLALSDRSWRGEQKGELVDNQVRSRPPDRSEPAESRLRVGEGGLAGGVADDRLGTAHVRDAQVAETDHAEAHDRHGHPSLRVYHDFGGELGATARRLNEVDLRISSEGAAVGC